MARKKATKKKVAKKKATKRKTTRKQAPKAAARKSSRSKGPARASARPNAKKPWAPNPKQKAVVERLKTRPTIRPACASVGTSVSQFYTDMRTHPEFKAAVEEARALGFESMEEEAMRLAMEGDEEVVISGGKIVMREVDDNGDALPKPIPFKRRKRSERLMELILKGNLKGKYGTNRTELTGKDGAAISTKREEPAMDLSKLSGKELETLIAIKKKGMGIED